MHLFKLFLNIYFTNIVLHIQVNSHIMVDYTPERVRAEIANSGDVLELVIARPKALEQRTLDGKVCSN